MKRLIKAIHSLFVQRARRFRIELRWHLRKLRRCKNHTNNAKIEITDEMKERIKNVILKQWERQRKEMN